MKARLLLNTVALREDGAFGVLLWDGRPFAVSCERTFSRLETIIRRGVWECKRDFYHKGGYETFEILIPGHSRLLFHKGNTELDSLGCILVAESFGQLREQTAVLDSKTGFAEFMHLTAGLDTFYLEVIGR